jgi:hypothetical protein
MNRGGGSQVRRPGSLPIPRTTEPRFRARIDVQGGVS